MSNCIAPAARWRTGLKSSSAATFKANQLRLYFASFAYLLMHAVRRLGTKGTRFARAQCTTLRLALLKIAARIKVTARRVWLSYAQSYAYAPTFLRVLANLQRYPVWRPARITPVLPCRTGGAPPGEGFVRPEDGQSPIRPAATTRLTHSIPKNHAAGPPITRKHKGIIYNLTQPPSFRHPTVSLVEPTQTR